MIPDLRTLKDDPGMDVDEMLDLAEQILRSDNRMAVYDANYLLLEIMILRSMNGLSEMSLDKKIPVEIRMQCMKDLAAEGCEMLKTRIIHSMNRRSQI